MATRNLFIYSKDFNRDELDHVASSTTLSYLTWLATYNLAVCPLNDYRINNGRILISKAFFATKQFNWLQALYFADVPTDDKERSVFYHVKRAYEQSDFIVFEVALDEWGTFFAKGAFSNVHIIRCNRKISEGIYDPVKEVEGRRQDYYENGSFNQKAEELTLIVLCTIELNSTFLQGVGSTQNFLIALPMASVLGMTYKTQYANTDAILKAQCVVGSLSDLQSTGWPTKVVPLRAWLLPNYLVKTSNVGLASVGFNNCFMLEGANGTGTISNVPLVRAGESTKEFFISDFMSEKEFVNSRVQFGVANNSLPIVKYTEERLVLVRSMITATDVKVQIEQGGNVRDVSASFEFEFTTNSQGDSALNKLAGIASKLLNTTASAGASAVVGNYLGAGAKAVNDLTGILTPEKLQGANSTNGDAIAIYSLNDAVFCFKPFHVEAWNSEIDQLERAYLYGVEMEKYSSDWPAIQACENFGMVTEGKERDSTFLVADRFNVEGLPMNAEAYIRSEFARGIWLLSV